MTEAAGQGVRFVTAMKPSRQIVFDMVEEALACSRDSPVLRRTRSVERFRGASLRQTSGKTSDA